MYLRQIPDAHLAQYSYLIGCQRSGEAIVIDPERDIDRYEDLAKAEGLRISAVAETHIHADFVSGARELAARHPDLKLYLSIEGGPDWQSEWAKALPGFHGLRDGDTFKIGNIELKAIHTPGHTPEHMVFLVTDHGGGANEPMAMLSGDFLFVGDAGRPDLLEQAAGLEGTQEAGARALYHSLKKVAELPCHVQILPAHGAGSACGKALGAVPNSTFGYEEKFNPALKIALEKSETEFVNFILSGQPEPPAYFARMKHLNKVGPDVLGVLPPVKALETAELSVLLGQPETVVLDTRPRAPFLASHIKGSLFTPPEKFSDFTGSYLDAAQNVVLLADSAEAAGEFRRQLLRIGFERVAGFVSPAVFEQLPVGWKTSFPWLDFAGLPARLEQSPVPALLDVRKATELAAGHLRGAVNIAHTRLKPRLAEVPKGPLVLTCQSGMRATGAASFLHRQGLPVECVADAFEHAPAALVVKPS